MSKPGHVLVIEPNPTGHRMAYVRWVAEGVVRAGFPVLVATARSALGNPLLRALMRDSDSNTEVQVTNEPVASTWPPRALGLAVQQWSSLAWYRNAFRQAIASHRLHGVVLPYADAGLYALALAGSPFGELPWVAITMRTNFDAQGRPESKLRAAAIRRIGTQPTMRGLFCINPSMQKMPSGNLSSFLHYLADPAEIRVAAERNVVRRRLGIANHAHVVLLFGAIHERKGLAELLAGVERLPPAQRPTVLVAGLQSSSIRALLGLPDFVAARREGRLVEMDQFLDDAGAADAFAAADSAWLGYVGHESMSGVLVLAARAGLPVIACDKGEIAALAKSLGLGPSVDVGDAEAVARALQDVMQPANRARYAANASPAFAPNTPAAFAETLLAPLLQPGRPP